MQGKVVGIYLFTSKKNNSEWARVFVQQDMPEGGFGYRVDNIMCTPNRLPMSPKDMVGKSFFISTNNNFASDFFCID